MSKPQESLFLISLTAMLDTSLPLIGWEKPETDPVAYYSINEYVALYGHSVEQFSADGTMFAKDFNWTVSKIDEVREKSEGFGLEYGVNVFILNNDELMDMIHSKTWLKTNETT